MNKTHIIKWSSIITKYIGQGTTSFPKEVARKICYNMDILFPDLIHSYHEVE